MNIHNFKNKKIGIWGFGIVGKSVYNYVKQFTDQIQILDHKEDANFTIIKQTPQTILQFLNDNEIIIPSPGIILHEYQNYASKFVHELDIFAQNYHAQTIAITGTVGKTTITSLLTQCIPNAIAAGNIGHAMLNALHENPNGPKIILELSSYQLQYAQHLAPDIAIWTNFYPNHLDHHKDESEYFQAKCNVLKNQTANQIALLPYELIDKIKSYVTPKAQVFLFKPNGLDFSTVVQTTTDLDRKYKNKEKSYPIFFVQNNQLILTYSSHHREVRDLSPFKQRILIFDKFNQLPPITFAQNWIIILAALHLQKIPIQKFLTFAQTLKPEKHRLEFVKTLNNVQVYNDSKSTIWQATQQAVDQFDTKQIALFLGGISKGTDRTPLFENLAHKNVNVFAFGKEAKKLGQICQKFQITHFCASTLEQAIDQYILVQSNFEILLFSPAGASFDLFKNFEDRGDQFKSIINTI